MGKPKYIDAEEFIRKIGQDLELSSCMPEDWCRGVRFVLYRIKNELAADVVEVVRCADCKYQDKGENDCEEWNLCGYRPWLYIQTEDDAFCSKGERKDG